MKTKTEIKIARMIILARCHAFNHFLAHIIATLEFYDSIRSCTNKHNVLEEINNLKPYATYENTILINYEGNKENEIEKFIEEVKNVSIATPYIIALLSDSKNIQAKVLELAYAGVDRCIIAPIESVALKDKLGSIRRQA